MTRIALVDLSGCFWRCWHATKDQELSAAYENTIAMVYRFVDAFDRVAICCDAPPYWRKDVHPEYKAQRDKPEAQAIEQLRRVEARLAADGFCIWKCQSYEADDVIATAVKFAVAEGTEVVIGSSDKDMLQLVSDTNKVSALSLATQLVYDDAAVYAKFGVMPCLMRDLLSLVGDRSDNVPGVPGIGEKTAAKLLKEFGTLADLLARYDEIPSGKQRAAIAASVEVLALAHTLIGLKDDAPIDYADCMKPRVTKPLTEPEEILEEKQEQEPPSAPEVAAELVPAVAPQQTKAIQKTNRVDLTTAPASSFEGGLQPGTLGAAWKLAEGIHNSRLYPRLPNAEAVWAIIIRGREMGLGALTALDSITIVEGRPAPGAHLLVARAKNHPHCEYFQFLGGDDTFAEYETKNKTNPKPTRLKYTIEQARKAGLIRQRGNWESRPAEMLRKTAAVHLARIEYPEALLGAYAAEELEGVS